MPQAHRVNVELAQEAEARGDALAATVRWCLAAEAAGGGLERVEAMAAARRSAELALHQAVYEAARAGRTTTRGASWRALAEAAGMPFQTLYRRYRHAPERPAPRRRGRARPAG